MTINFQDPRLQRTRQKMAALSPESAALFDNAAATGDFAKNDMMRQLALMRTSHALKSRQENFANRQRERMGQLNLAKDKFDFEKSQGRTGAIISALGLIPQGYMGYKVYQESDKKAADIMKLANQISLKSIKFGG